MSAFHPVSSFCVLYLSIVLVGGKKQYGIFVYKNGSHAEQEERFLIMSRHKLYSDTRKRGETNHPAGRHCCVSHYNPGRRSNPCGLSSRPPKQKQGAFVARPAQGAPTAASPRCSISRYLKPSIRGMSHRKCVILVAKVCLFSRLDLHPPCFQAAEVTSARGCRDFRGSSKTHASSESIGVHGS